MKGNIILKKYYVDLRSYSADEAEKLYSKLQNLSFDTYIIPSIPKVYEVILEEELCISELTGIPDHLVSFYLPSNN